MRHASPTVSRRELAGVLLVLALVCAWPLRDSLFTTERAVFGADCATVQLPWSAHPERAPAEVTGPRPRNPSLSDQAHGFYPFYRWVSESWRRGDPPLWNPLVYAGVPGLGNPQTGALDPQVLVLVALDALFGIDGFHWGLTATSWLRMVAAGAGAWLLARALGLGRPGAALAATTFALSGFVLLWLGFSLGHVAPTLPWLLFFLERVRGRRPGRAVAGVAVTTALSIYAGHPETTFYAGVAAGAWALALLRDGRRAGLLAFAGLVAGALLAAPLVLPFLEYLSLSAAQLIREHRSRATSIDLVALGALLVAGGVLAIWRQRGEEGGASGLRADLPRAIALALGAAGVALALGARGGGSSAALVLLPDLFGFPGRGAGYLGPGTLAEEASGWVPFASLALAAAALLRREGPLARRGLVAGLALVALLLALHVPGLVDLYRRIPSVGLGAPVRFAVVSALMLGLLAGEALESAPERARRAASVALLGLVALVLARPAPSVLAPGVERGAEADELVGFVELPPARAGVGAIPVTGWVSGRLPAASARLRVEAADARGIALAGGERHAFPVELEDPPPGAEPEAPPGARWFRVPSLTGGPLAHGAWRMTLEVLGEDGTVLGERRVAVVERRAERDPSTWTLLLVGASAGALFGPALAGWRAWAVVALALAQGLAFARGVLPAVPRAELFPETRTERLIAREQGSGRYLGDEGVLPPSTGMVRGLRAAGGYDGMDVADFNVYRSFAVRPGLHPLLAWNPRGVDLDGAAFRLLGVTLLATRAPLEHAGWELVAGPRGAPEPAEVLLYRARDPLPRAFVAGELRPAGELAADLAGWDPLEVATWEGEGTIDVPRTRWSVEELGATNNEVRYAVELDGDGLLVSTEQHFPGWTVTVDGEPAELAAADAIFRGVLLEGGRHEVVFRYRPRGLTAGLALALVGALAAAAAARSGRFPRGSGRAGRASPRRRSP